MMMYASPPEYCCPSGVVVPVKKISLITKPPSAWNELTAIFTLLLFSLTSTPSLDTSKSVLPAMPPFRNEMLPLAAMLYLPSSSSGMVIT